MSDQQTLDDWIYDLSKPGRVLSREDLRDLGLAVVAKLGTERHIIPEWCAGLGAAPHEASLTIFETLLYASISARDLSMAAKDNAEDASYRGQFMDLFFERQFGPAGYRSEHDQRIVKSRGEAPALANTNGHAALPGGHDGDH